MTPVTLCLAVMNCRFNRFDTNLSTCLALIDQAVAHHADLVVFPEMNLTGYAAGEAVRSIARPVDPALVDRFSDIADRHHLAILVGLAENGDNTDIFASHLVFMPHSPHGRYRKIHTAPNEQGTLTPGNRIPVFEHADLRFGIQLCYDAHFPELSTAMAMRQADLIILPHASPRGDAMEKYRSWMRHLPARAFDNGLFIAAVNQTGDNGAGLEFPGLSLVIGPDGKMVSRSVSSNDHLHTVVLDPDRLRHVRSHRMRYFLPFRRDDLFPVTG